MSSTKAGVSPSTGATKQPLIHESGSGNAAPETQSSKRDYKGFVAGVFSGITKLSGECSFVSFYISNCLVASELYR